jgi:heme-degrading monooxygenase HmoA
MTTTENVFDGLQPLSSDYAVRRIDEVFNWRDCLGPVDEGEWYVVAFRSVRRPEADDPLLYRLDEHALAEARAHGGLLHYFSGELDDERRCLSMCVWESRERAREGAALPAHTEAIGISGATYTSYVLERYRLTKRDGAVELVELEPPQHSAAVDGRSS